MICYPLIHTATDKELLEFLRRVEPPRLIREPEMLMLLDVLRRREQVDAITAAAELQRRPEDMPELFNRLREARVGHQQIVTETQDAPLGSAPELRLSERAGELLPRKVERW